MRSRTDFVQVTDAHVEDLLQNMRQADRDELVAANGFPYEDNVREGVRTSVLSWSMLIDSEVAAIFGVGGASVMTGVGSPWLLGTTRLEGRGGRLVRFGPRYIQRMLNVFPSLENVVDARNEASLRWLRRLGFTIEPAQPAGPYGELFHRFHMESQ